MIRLLALLLALALPAAPARAEPVTLTIGVFMTAIANVDIAAGTFDYTAYLWTIDPSGSFDPTRDMVPLAGRATVSVVEQHSLPDGSAYTVLRIEGSAVQDFDIRHFPFDRHTLRLPFELEHIDGPPQVHPDTGDSAIADVVAVRGWTVGDMRFTTEEVRYQTGFGVGRDAEFARFTVLIDIERYRSQLVVNKFIGYLLALMITPLIYLVPMTQIGVRIGMVTSAIFAGVGNRYTFDTVLGPETAFGLVDQLTVIVFSAIFVALAVTLVTDRLLARDGPARAARFNRAAGIAASLLAFGLAAAAILAARQ